MRGAEGATRRAASRRASAKAAQAKRSPLLPPEHALPGVAGGGAELFFDADELVVLGEAVGARQRAGLDLPAIGGDGEGGARGIPGLAPGVRHHARVAAAPRPP